MIDYCCSLKNTPGADKPSNSTIFFKSCSRNDPENSRNNINAGKLKTEPFHVIFWFLLHVKLHVHHFSWKFICFKTYIISVPRKCLFWRWRCVWFSTPCCKSKQSVEVWIQSGPSSDSSSVQRRISPHVRGPWGIPVASVGTFWRNLPSATLSCSPNVSIPLCNPLISTLSLSIPSVPSFFWNPSDSFLFRIPTISCLSIFYMTVFWIYFWIFVLQTFWEVFWLFFYHTFLLVY